MDLLEKILQGDARSAARLMTLVEDGAPEAIPVLKALYPHTGSALVVGVTGPSGSGKSTLVDRITTELRRLGKTVGIVAVDPSSPFTGGAILADRIRMQQHSLDEEVFIRSMATRGHLGGLAAATSDVVDILDAMGKDCVLVETVGVGQDEIEVVRAAHTCIVVTVPGLGDEVQASKAGLMEIGDLFAVNKADREGAERTAQELEAVLHFGRVEGGWAPPIFKTVAVTGEGVLELTRGIFEHDGFLQRTQGRQRKGRQRSAFAFYGLLRERLAARVLERLGQREALERLIDRIAARETDPHSAVEAILGQLGLQASPEATDHGTDPPGRA